MHRGSEEDYKKAIMDKYEKDKFGDLRLYLFKPTPKNIRERLFQMQKLKLINTAGENVIRNYLGISKNEDLWKKVRDINISEFKPIQSFLNEGGQKKVHKPDILEMIALLVGYQHAESEPDNLQENNETTSHSPVENDEMRNENDFSIANNIVIKNKIKNSVGNRWMLPFIIFIIIALFALFSGILPINPNTSSTNNYHIENVFVSDSNKIIPNKNTQFFNDDGQPKVWYTNYKGEMEFYDTSGKHPSSNQPLQPVSKEVFETFVSKNILNVNDEKSKSSIQTSANKTESSPNSKEISVVMLNSTYQTDAGVTNILGKWLTEKGYAITSPFITSNTSTNETISRLQALDSDYFNVNLKDYSNYICIGTVSYSYTQNSMIAGRTNCKIQLDFQIISTADATLIDSYSNLFIGNGSDSISSKNNTIKKISL